MGVKYTLRLELGTPGGVETVTNTVLAGNLTAIGLGGREVTAPTEGSESAAAVLSGLAFRYLTRWNDSDAELSSLLRVVPVRPTVSVCFVMSEREVEYAGGDPLYPLSFDWKGTTLENAYGRAKAKFVPISYKDQWGFVREIDDEIGRVPVLR